MDQVIKKKKTLMIKKCLNHIKDNSKGFMMIEIKIFPKGNVKSRLIATEIKSPEFIKCSLSILNRIKFKKISDLTMTRIYRFFIL